MRRPWLIGVIVLVVAAIVLANTVFIVDQRQQALVVNLGNPVRVINPPGALDPGLKTKIPFAESVVTLDKRNQAIEAAQEEVISSDQQRLVVDAFVRFRIADPLAFYRTLSNEAIARDHLELLVNSSLRQVLGGASAADIISRQRSTLTGKALDDVRGRAAAAQLGIEVVDLRIRRVELPAANAEAVYQHMTSNLQQRAAQIRAQGEASKRDIVANADKQVTITLAKANEQAFAVRGAGDAQAAQLYAAAYGKDPRFAAFYRTMRAYQDALAQKGTTLVLTPDSDFLKYFRQGPGVR